VYETPRATRRAPDFERTRPGPAGIIALVIWFLFAGIALLLAVSTVSAFSGLTKDLPPPGDLDDIAFQEESIVYDRTGTVELARFGQARREVVTFDEIPAIVIDTQTAIEDRTFWENTGFDPLAIISAGVDSLRGRSRGASTITQQLVRQRLLDPDLVQDPKRQVERKLKEIIQSIRLTSAFPGEEGKQQIITAYLNQNYYGNQSYGIKAAAQSYFGKQLDELTIAEAAILAGLPKSPSNYDLVLNAIEECDVPVAEDGTCPGKATLVVPEDSEIVQRRNQILDLLAEGGRTPLSGDKYTAADFLEAKDEPVVLAKQQAPNWIAPHFVWAVQKELATKLCGEDVATCPELENGGLRIQTTLDTKLQEIAEKWVKGSTVVPSAKDPAASAKGLGLKYETWMKNLRDKNVRNGALVALDYQTGELVAYVGSANYYSTKSSPQFQPKYDVVGSGFRQPGSAFKPFNYLTGIDDRILTAGTMLMDSAADFGGGYTPSDADNLERGPVRVRTALQFSLNIPSVKAVAINKVDHVFARSTEFGMRFRDETSPAGLALALGVQEVRPIDLITAYGTLANGGSYVPHTTILAIKDASGGDVLPPETTPQGAPVASPQAAYIVTDMLAGNTNKDINPFWGEFAITNEGGDRRPATLKTGTNNDAKDLNAYGFIAPPTAEGRAAGEFALAVGAWNGNSDNSVVTTPSKPVFSIDVTTFVWQGFLAEASKTWAINDFAVPADGLVKAKIDPWTGLQPATGGPSVEEWFIAGTEPTTSLPEGLCGSVVLDYVGYEKNFENWMRADRDWLARARRGPGTIGGVNGTRVTYFYNGRFTPYGRSWGPFVEGRGCSAPSPVATCFAFPTPDASGVIPSFELPTPNPSASGSAAPLVPCPTASPSEPPSESPSAAPTPTPEITQPPTQPPTDPPTQPPTDPPSDPPSVPPSVAAPPAAATPAASPSP
jgi:membrane peptidoglycan carboxypeptidase